MKKSRIIMDNLFFVMKHIYLWKKSIFLSIGLYSIFYSISPFIWIYTPKFLIDELLGEKRISYLLLVLASALIMAAVVGFFTDYLKGNYRMKMNTVRYNFIHMLSEKTMTMNFAYTEDTNTLNDINTALKTIQNPNSGIGLVILKLFSIPGNLLGFVGFVTILFQLSPIILFILILSVYLSYLIMLKAKNYERSKKDLQSREERESYYISRVLSDFEYGKDIRVYGLKNILLKKKDETNDRLKTIVNDIQNRNFTASVLESGLILIRECIIYFYLIFKVLYSGLPISDFVMYSIAMSSFVTWVDTTMKDIADIRIQSLYISDFRKFLQKEEPKEIIDPVPIPACEQYDIELNNISFHYPNSEHYIFKDFTLHIKAGEKLAIVGINGAGKTTLVKLITGLYEPTSGSILLNGIDIKRFNRNEYIKLLSVVFQEIKLFSFSIRENITLQDKCNDELYDKAVELAGIKNKIDALKKGSDTMLLKILDETGIELSGGENQKLTMARALYKEGSIIIMDEPTAALDALAENQLYQSFDRLIQKKTAIYISHRLSSTRFCDAIAFIENGQLMEYGTHEELMKLGRLYANMYEIQARYYKEDTNAS